MILLSKAEELGRMVKFTFVDIMHAIRKSHDVGY